MIGIAGLIGSGKSAVAHMLEQAGYSVIFADDEAHVLYKEHKGVREQLAQRFGSDILTSDGVDRARLGAVVFADPHALMQLESIIHPVLFQHLIAKLQASPQPAFLEGALLPCWPHLLAQLDQVWVVEANAELRLARVISRGLPESEARKRMQKQESFPAIQHAHLHVIQNEKGLQELQAQVDQLLNNL